MIDDYSPINNQNIDFVTVFLSMPVLVHDGLHTTNRNIAVRIIYLILPGFADYEKTFNSDNSRYLRWVSRVPWWRGNDRAHFRG